jgi:para-nitrobenzyl esterase
VMTYWTNFARTGDPNGNGAPAWPRYDKTKQVLYLDEPIASGPDRTQAASEFLATEAAGAGGHER